MIKLFLYATMIVASLSTYAGELPTYDQYVYYGDVFKLNVHRGNVVLVKHKNDVPFYLNDGKPFDTDSFQINIDSPISTGEYKLLELELLDGIINNFWETTVYVSEHRSCFGPLPMVSHCSNK